MTKPIQPRSTAYEIYKEPDQQLKHVSNALKFSNRVVPGHTTGGVVAGFNPRDPRHMKIVINPHTDSVHELDLSSLSPEAIRLARTLSQQTEQGIDDIDLQRNIAAGTLDLLVEAQKIVEDTKTEKLASKTATSSPHTTSTKKLVEFVLPVVGKLAVYYDVAEVSSGKLILGVAEADKETTFLPPDSITSPIPIKLGDKTYVGYTTAIQYTAADVSYVVLMVEEQT